METTYTQRFTLSDLYLDCFGRLKPSVLFYLIQEVSGKHASMLGASWEALAEKNLFWAIIRHQVELVRLPQAGETITLKTWPMPTTRVAYPRATVAYDERGNVLFRSHAIWVLMDTNTRTMVLPGKSGVEVCGHLEHTELDAPGSIPKRDLFNHVSRTVGYTHLDRNGHMNNTYYLDWVADLLDSAFHREKTLQRLNISYLAEAREGQTIDLRWEKSEEDSLQVEAQTDGENAHRVFAVQAQYGPSVRVM